MNHLPGYIDTATGQFCASHKNMDIIIDLATGVVSERVSVPEHPNLEVNIHAINAISLVLPEDQKWEVQTAGDKSYPFFYRTFKLSAYPTINYMDGIVGWFEWFFHKNDVYNVTGVPF